MQSTARNFVSLVAPAKTTQLPFLVLSSKRAKTLSSSPFVRRDLSSIGTQAAQKWNRLAFAPSSSG